MNIEKTKNQKTSFIFDTQITTHAIRITDSDATRVLNNAEEFLKIQKKVSRLYNLDKVCTIYDVYNIESAAIGQDIRYFKNDLPSVNIGNPLIKQKSDIYKIKNIDFLKNSRSRFVLDLIDIYKSELGTDFKPRFCAPFSLASNIRGYTNLINDIYEDANFIKELFKIINIEILAPWIEMQKERTGNPDVIASGADAWVSIPNVNIKIIEEIITPSYMHLEKLTGKIYISMLGGARFLKKPEKYLDIQRTLNPFTVKGFDPDAEILGPEFFADYANRNNMDLLLGLEANFIQNSSLAVIYKRIKKYISAAQNIKGCFTLYFNDIPASVSIDKMKKIFDFVIAQRTLMTSFQR